MDERNSSSADEDKVIAELRVLIRSAQPIIGMLAKSQEDQLDALRRIEEKQGELEEKLDALLDRQAD